MTWPGRPRGRARWTSAIATAAGTALALAASGCGAQAEPGYLGEPLIALAGQVDAGTAGSALPLEAAVLWQKGAPPTTGDQVLAVRAPVEGGAFTVRLYQPPPPEVLRRLAPGEPAFARATAAALPLGLAAPDVASPATTGSQAYGIDPDHWLLYLAADVAPGSLTAWWLGAASTGLPAGYHLARVRAVDPTCLSAAALAACTSTVAAAGAASGDAAQALCLAPYQLEPAPEGEPVTPALGTRTLPAAAGACP